jgi:hypothetical protein
MTAGSGAQIQTARSARLTAIVRMPCHAPIHAPRTGIPGSASGKEASSLNRAFVLFAQASPTG